ncbi:hypothetical protein QAD02_023546 [Eretmocerus hayati]|uniref:Uncharacterized protein n=1 Tax=Eretmocerus hayati TaxID=131215 RepID=A0ACC2PWI1_9HYME|nr:hypothetical protein QAD02_023546 [Eretmocerus hayati]
MQERRVESVLGPIEASKLGRTLTHEHLAIDFAKFYTAPPKLLKGFVDRKIDLHNIGVIRQYPYSSEHNIHLTDPESADAVIEDIKFYKKSGGGTIVENTNHGIKRNISFMQEVSKKTGIHVIAGTGHYVALTQNGESLSATEEDIYNIIIQDMTVGCPECPSVKTGFIGEVASAWPIQEFERKAIRAAALAQQQLNCGVSFHPGRDPAAPFEIIRTFQEAGGNADRTVMSHLDRTLLKDEDLLSFSELGSYCQFDLFGTECSYYQLHDTVDMPSDAQRVDKMSLLKRADCLEKLLMSHDVHTKHRLMKFGGHGFSHIFNNVVPKMKIKGFTNDEIDTITIRNPANWLCGSA